MKEIKCFKVKIPITTYLSLENELNKDQIIICNGNAIVEDFEVIFKSILNPTQILCSRGDKKIYTIWNIDGLSIYVDCILKNDLPKPYIEQLKMFL